MTIGTLTLSGRQMSTVHPTSRLIDHCRAYIQQAASVPGGQKAMFTAATGGLGPGDVFGGTYTRNPNQWMPYIDFTSSPVWVDRSSSPRTWGRGCLVTPVNMLAADHFGFSTGGIIIFQGASGTLYQRTCVTVDRTIGTDIQTVLLDEDLPSDVRPAKLLPADVATWITSTDLANEFPAVTIDADLQLLATQWTGYAFGTRAVFAVEDDAPSSSFTQAAAEGDSGSANYLIINGEAVLYTEHWFEGNGPAYHLHRTAIDASIATLGGGYAIQSINLYGFAT